jgi:NADH dehydrogenase [ubiquinone] 1 alpha subcomplex assembly factor 1
MTKQLFRFDTAASTDSWQAIDDVVMGGVSASRFSWRAEGWAVFSGVVSLANNGGFASVRAPVAVHDGGGAAFLLTVRSDGQRYKFSVRTDQCYDGVAYQAVFQPPAAEWVTLRLAVADFVPSWRGRSVDNASPLDPARLQQLGLLIADRQEGVFRLEVRAIELAD